MRGREREKVMLLEERKRKNKHESGRIKRGERERERERRSNALFRLPNTRIHTHKDQTLARQTTHNAWNKCTHKHSLGERERRGKRNKRKVHWNNTLPGLKHILGEKERENE